MPYVFSDLEVNVGPQEGARSIIVTWKRAAAEFEAVMVRRGDRPVCRTLTVRDENGVQPSVRRMPSDTDIVAAIGRLAERGSAYLLFIMEEGLYVEDLPSVSERLINKRLKAFQRELGQRPRRHQPELVDLANQLLADEIKTSDVVTILMSKGHVSESTAYRVIRQARARGHHG